MKKQKHLLYVLILSLLFAFSFSVLVACPGNGNGNTDCYEHDWEDVEITKTATCTEDGAKIVKCKNCGITRNATIKSEGHKWDDGEVQVAATCYSEGSKLYTCTIDSCGKTKTEKISKTEHLWAETATVIEATERTRGMSYIACTRNGCDGKKDITGIAPTGAVKTATYRIYINRGNGKKFTTSPTVNLTYPEGNVTYPTGRTESIAQSSMSYNTYGESAYIEKELPLDTYTFSIPKVQDGFETEEYYTISQDDGEYPYDSEDKYPTVHINIHSNPLPMAANGALGARNMVGDVIRDFKFTAMHPGDWEPQEYTLSEILSQYKMVWFNMYYNACPNCLNEREAVDQVYNKYKNDVAFIMFNNRDGVNGIKQGNQTTWHMPESVFFVDDSQVVNGNEKFLAKFGATSGSGATIFPNGFGSPTNIFIDNGGYICYIAQGAKTVSILTQQIENNLFWNPKNDPEKKAEATAPNLLEEVKSLIAA